MALLHSPMLCVLIGFRHHTEVGLNVDDDIDADVEVEVDELLAETA
jgi:hypothetical protein